MDIPTTEESGLQRWRYFCESTFSSKSFQVFLLSFERLRGHLFLLLSLSFPKYYIRMIWFLSTVYFLVSCFSCTAFVTCLLKTLHWIAWLSFLLKSCLKETKLNDVNDEYSSCFFDFHLWSQLCSRCFCIMYSMSGRIHPYLGYHASWVVFSIQIVEL